MTDNPRATTSLLRLTLILGALSAFTPLAVDMYLPGLPALERTLNTDSGGVQRTLSVFFLGLAIGQLILGPLSDRYGRRGPLLVGNLLYIGASVACALAPSIDSLIAARFVQAFGSCAGMVISRAMVRDLFEPREGARVMSLLMLVTGVAPILAPMLGGAVLAVFDWHAIFWLIAGFATLVMISARLWLRETRGPQPDMRLTLGSALRVYAELLTTRRYMGYALASSFGLGGLFSYIAASPFVFIDLYQLSPQAFGWVFGINAVGIIGFSQVNRALLRHFTLDEVLIVALFSMATAGLLLLVCTAFSIGGIWGVWIPLFLYITSLGAVLPNAAASAMATEAHRAGSAAALIGTMQFGLGALTSGLVSLLHASPSLGMGMIVAACGITGLSVRLILVR
ncbi:Bcr/CflA family multidrug efflux MFS transporter [Ferrovibrio sp.]|uniref:Bcr/CflA family multidrug efflux MFS transporter n=1 Tax=Ferrovibrio sp. TaxID=1917215 RepID=UPI000CBE563E|nr:Bcr/CflA family multidrug efflux MFS transporter [Ferrovibrio sp.]PJI44512.1 MAG: Bcr/CflA family drug resistance efflux transporter [Ferrovibrio sp.]